MEEEWTEWAGGDCPVDGLDVVEVRFRNGETCTGVQAGEVGLVARLRGERIRHRRLPGGAVTAALEIPADVMAAAREVVREWCPRGSTLPRLEGIIARTILAERQRAADYVSRRPGSIAHRQEIVSGLLRGDVCDASGSITRGPTA